MQEQLTIDTQALMRDGIAAAKSGNRELARNIFLQLVKERPNDDLAWVCLASLTDSLQIRIGYLKKALDLNPKNQKASEFLSTDRAGDFRTSRSERESHGGGSWICRCRGTNRSRL
jgi:hypothetical protein